MAVCANFATFTVAAGTLAATGVVYAPPCAEVDSVVLSQGEYAAIMPKVSDFDYAYAGQIWGLAFSFVLGLYLISKSAGLVLEFIRR